MATSPAYLEPETLAAISGLGYKARLMVEGFLSGAHRSPYRGFSVEFAQHREYVPGDDLRHLDWKVWGRSDRLYIKQYDAETNFEAHILLDASGSMGFSTAPLSKLEYGKHAAAALAQLILDQRDAVGLNIFGDEPVSMPPSTSPARMRELIHHLETAEPGGEATVAEALTLFAEKGGRRKVLVVISDFMEDENELLKSLRYVSRRRHDVLLVHLVDPAEASLPYADLTSFAGLEGEKELRVHPARLRAAYVREMKLHVRAIRNSARELRMDYLPILTDRSLGEILAAYLVSRRGRK
ncbi:MAG: DUF58 domain-containing protein [Planctomycetota bacterium]|nr:DUF58 domain-containing protein [Planctomycetota bacterium]